MPLIDGGTLRLPRVIGQGRAMDMILTGRAVDAQEALSWGLANRAGEGRARRAAAAVALAKEIARFPQVCLRADRASAYAGWSMELDEALKAEARRGAPVVAKESDGGRGALCVRQRTRRGFQRDLDRLRLDRPPPVLPINGEGPCCASLP